MSDADDDTPNDAGDENGAQGIERDEEVVEPAPLQLKVGGKAEHPTLRIVEIVHIGPLGVQVEFFSSRLNAVVQRTCLKSDLRAINDAMPDTEKK